MDICIISWIHVSWVHASLHHGYIHHGYMHNSHMHHRYLHHTKRGIQRGRQRGVGHRARAPEGRTGRSQAGPKPARRSISEKLGPGWPLNFYLWYKSQEWKMERYKKVFPVQSLRYFWIIPINVPIAAVKCCWKVNKQKYEEIFLAPSGALLYLLPPRDTHLIPSWFIVSSQTFHICLLQRNA